MTAIRRILVPVDLAAASEEILRYGIAWAQLLDAELHVLHVVSSAPERALAELAGEVIPAIRKDWMRDAYLPPSAVLTRIEQLTGTRPDSDDPEGDATGGVRSAIRVGEPSVKIMAYADDVQADLLVMATHSRHAFAQMLPGGVAQKVLRKALCPVMTLSPIVCQRLRETRTTTDCPERVSA